MQREEMNLLPRKASIQRRFYLLDQETGIELSLTGRSWTRLSKFVFTRIGITVTVSLGSGYETTICYQKSKCATFIKPLFD